MEPLIEEKRQHPRYKIKKLAGYLKLAENGETIDCHPVDVSAGGVGIFSPDRLTPGATLFLVVDEMEIPFETIWDLRDWYKPKNQENEFIKKGFYRYGLVLKDDNYDLMDIFEKNGCFDD